MSTTDTAAPLDLGAMSDAHVRALAGRFSDHTMPALAEAAARVGFCSHPIRLAGEAHRVDRATGEIRETTRSRDLPLGLLYTACGNRRADVCPACSRVYARDTYAMIHAGVAGGKGVPAEVTTNPLVFVTLTAPSFGAVHGVRPSGESPSGGRCHPRRDSPVCPHGRPLSCMRVHAEDDEIVGSPLCWDCYDWEGAVVWQWHAPELWRRFTIALRRLLARELGVRPAKLGEVASPQFAKVAEFQARGLVHFHALIRLDGPDGAGSEAPLPGGVFAELLDAAARRVRCEVEPVDADDIPRVLAFGSQIDTRIVRTGAAARDELTADRVAAYLAKYSTKATGIHPGSPQAHLVHMAQVCRSVAARAIAVEGERTSPYRLLTRWAHMLGFRGHFSTKSRRFSTTLGRLRRARHRFRELAAVREPSNGPADPQGLEEDLIADDWPDGSILVVGSWTYQGSGWPRAGDRLLVEGAALSSHEIARRRARSRSAMEREKS